MAERAESRDRESKEALRLSAGVRAIVVASRHLERECVDAGLSLPQYRLLLFVRRGPQRAAELAARAAVRRPTLTALVDGLEKEGLLVRQMVEGDRRGIRLELTPKGAKALERAEGRLGGLLERMLRDGNGDKVLSGLGELANIIEQFYRRSGAS